LWRVFLFTGNKLVDLYIIPPEAQIVHTEKISRAYHLHIYRGILNRQAAGTPLPSDAFFSRPPDSRDSLGSSHSLLAPHLRPNFQLPNYFV
jgi:hypothetical protein